MSERTFGTLRANGLDFHYAAEGEPDAPLVLLLHGFPAFWYSWNAQLPALAAAGYRAVAIDMRGYNKTDKPVHVADYAVAHLVADVAAVIRALGSPRAHVVGHDWGGAVAWSTAIRAPGVVKKLVILNAPHPAAFRRELRTFEQLKKSWYMFLFQAPLVAERFLRQNDYAWIEKALSRRVFSAADIQLYKDAIAAPGALTASLAYYRAMVRTRVPKGASFRVDAPTLLLWGDADVALGVALSQGLERWVPDLRVEYLRGAGHWVQNERPDEVNAAIVRFLGEP